MNKSLEMLLACTLLVFAGTPLAQQATPPATAASASQPPGQSAEQPVLKLRLNEIERRPVITFTPKDPEKQGAAPALPGLGGKPSKNWEQPTDAVVPKSSDSLY